MATFNARIYAVTTNGPYAYVLFKDGVGVKALDQVASVTAALNGVRDDIAAQLAGESVLTATLGVTSG